MKITIRLFAGARHLAGADRVALELADAATVSGVRLALSKAIPALGPLLPTARIAVNLDFAADDARVPENAEVALIPPVSGG